MKYIKNDFSGGLNMVGDTAKIGGNQYPLLVNGRIRSNVIRPVKLPSLVDELPDGIVQGLYAYGPYLIVIKAGFVYFKDYTVENPTFEKLVGTNLSATAPIVYCEAVTSSFMNFSRKLADPADNSTINLSGLADSVNGSPAGIVLQDLEHDPNFITPDKTVSTTDTFANWDKDNNRRYIPKGSMMLFENGILHIVGKDNKDKYTLIMNSVTGRPIDFMVNVDQNGEKGASEELTGAKSTSHRVGFNPITAINRIPTQSGGFLVSTLGGCTLVIPDYNNLWFSEPKYRNIDGIPTGMINPFSIADINGDTAFIDQTGLKSFNTVRQTTTESNSNPFSREVESLFVDITQTTCCACNFDNYALFAVNTIYGPAIIIYDTNFKQFVGLDIYPGVGLIKQFAVMKVEGERHLFFSTVDNEIYEAFTGGVATCRFYCGDFSSGTADTWLIPSRLYLAFTDVRNSGIVQATLFADGRKIEVKPNEIIQDTIVPTVPSNLPFGDIMHRKSRPMLFNLIGRSQTCWKAGILLEWNCDASISDLVFSFEEDRSNVPLLQRIK